MSSEQAASCARLVTCVHEVKPVPCRMLRKAKGRMSAAQEELGEGGAGRQCCQVASHLWAPADVQKVHP